MPRYFLDYYDDTSVIIDDEGQDLPSLDAARAEARRTIAEGARALMAKGGDGQIKVEVRDKSSVLLRVTATFLTELLD
jgi:hypothetical protein